MVNKDSTIDVGIEDESGVNDPDAEVYGYVDDGEYAVIWAVHEDQGHYRVTVYNCEAGICDDVHAFTVDADEYELVYDLARELANDDPVGSVKAAREYWE